MTTAVAEKETVKLDARKVKSNDVMAITYFVRTLRVENGGQKVLMEDLDSGQKFWLEGKDLLERSTSADQVLTEKKVTKTEAAELVVSAHNVPFTVCFDKVDGTERVMRCRLVSPEPLLGRSHVVDLDITEKHNLRQVDHRSIKWLILNTVKYVVK